MVPFQKGPCGEGGRMRGFLLPLLVVVVVVVGLVLFLLILVLVFPSSRNTKVNRNKIKKKRRRAERAKLFSFGWRRSGGTGREVAKNIL